MNLIFFLVLTGAYCVVFLPLMYFGYPWVGMVGGVGAQILLGLYSVNKF